MSEIAKRSEILFCYDARMSNPNGDPDENRPRIDPATRRNLVTDFRLKRTVRDFLQKQEQRVFIRAEKDDAGNLKQIEDLAKGYIVNESGKAYVKKDELLKDHIDLRLFGILFAVKVEVQQVGTRKTKQENISFKQIGPVQFAIGQSLNQVEELTIRMSRVVPTREEASGGTFGEKSVLRYSFIAFRGFINDIVAAETKLSEDDVMLMLRAMWHGTNNLSTTSKYGQQSRLLVRIVYKGQYTYIGDIDRAIGIDSNGQDVSKFENISQFTLNIDKLIKLFESNADVIEEIQYISNSELACKYQDKVGTFNTLLEQWHNEVGKQKGIKLSQLDL